MMTIFLLLIFILSLFYYKATKNFNIFAERGIINEKPMVIFGNIFKAAIDRENIFIKIHELYEKFKDEK